MHITTAVCSLALSAFACAQTPVRITGLVVDGEGRPLPGVGLAVGNFGQGDITDLPREWLARTDSAGRLDAQVVLDYRSVVVIGTEGGAYQWREVHHENLWPGRLDFGCITLPKGRTIRGLVRTAEGKPVAGAQVDALDVLAAPHSVLTGGMLVSSTRTDAKGRFALEGIADRGAMVTVKKPGFYLARFPHASPFEPLVVKLQPGGSVEGKVLDESGVPVTASWIIVRYEQVEETRWRPTRDGMFQFDLDYPGKYCIWALEQTWDRTSKGRSAVLSGAQRGVTIKIDRKTRGHIEPLVLGKDDKALQGAEAAALWGRAISNSDPKPIPVFLTGADGRTTFIGPSGKEKSQGMLFTRMPGHAMSLVDYSFNEERRLDTPTIRLVPESSIAGKVVDAETRAPVAGARVVAWHKNRKLAHIYFAMARRRFVVSDAKGEFRVSELPAGDWLLQVMHPQRPHLLNQPITVGSGQHRRDIVLAMPRGHRVRGRVTGDLGWPVLEISGYRQGGRTVRPYNSLSRMRIGLGPDGKFTTPGLSTGNYVFYASVQQPRLEGGRALIKVLEQQLDKDRVVNLKLTKKQVRVVKGRVKIRGASPPLHRLIVGAERNLLVQAVSMLAADGTYRFFSDDQPIRVLVQDLSTGAILYRSADLIEVGDAGIATHDVDIHLAMVRLRIQARDESASATRLKITVAHPGFKKRLLFRPSRYPYAAYRDGLLLQPGQVEVELYLPAIETSVQAFRGLLPEEHSLQTRRVPVGKIGFEPVPSQINRITLQIDSDG